MSKNNDFKPPNIAGLWTFRKRESLEQTTPDQNVTVDNIVKLENPFDVLIEQKAEFITVLGLQQNASNRTRLGVWKPTLNINGELTSWEVLLADHDDNQIAFIQVLKRNKCGKPKKLLLHSVESGFDKDNPEQHPEVSRAILVRKKF